MGNTTSYKRSRRIIDGDGKYANLFFKGQQGVQFKGPEPISENE
jgi:hypothetical protein